MRKPLAAYLLIVLVAFTAVGYSVGYTHAEKEMRTTVETAQAESDELFRMWADAMVQAEECSMEAEAIREDYEQLLQEVRP